MLLSGEIISMPESRGSKSIGAAVLNAELAREITFSMTD